MIFQYNDVLKFHCFSALRYKFNSILSKFPHLSQINTDVSAQVRSEWLAQFWSMQNSNKLGGLAVTECAGISLTSPLDIIFQKEQTANTDQVAESYPCTFEEMAVALNDMFNAELKQITNADHDRLR